MEIQVQQNIEFPLKDFENHGKDFLEASYAVSLFWIYWTNVFCYTNVLTTKLNIISIINFVFVSYSTICPPSLTELLFKLCV